MKKIYIDPGHSNVDPGAVGYAVEYELNEKTAKFMNDYLIANYECETKVGKNTDNTLSGPVREANEWEADLYVSIHNNAGGGDGWEGLVCNDARIELGKIFEKYVKEIGQNSRGVKIRSGLYVLKNTNMPAILNEGAFVDNKKDIQDWDEDAELKKLGIAYAKATAEALDLPKKLVKKPIKTFSAKLPVLSYGMKNNESVKALQYLMIGMGYSLNATGNFGAGTKSTLQKVQAKLGLPDSGVCDENTWNKIFGL